VLKPVVADSGSRTSYPEAPVLGIDVGEPGAASLEFTELKPLDLVTTLSDGSLPRQSRAVSRNTAWAFFGPVADGDQKGTRIMQTMLPVTYSA
jgi:hypothetical protein